MFEGKYSVEDEKKRKDRLCDGKKMSGLKIEKNKGEMEF